MNPATVVPSLIRLRQYAEACRITRGVALRRLRAVGILQCIGKRYYVGDSRLRERLPDDYERVYLWFEASGESYGT
jgi:hypothetical protein